MQWKSLLFKVVIYYTGVITFFTKGSFQKKLHFEDSHLSMSLHIKSRHIAFGSNPVDQITQTRNHGGFMHIPGIVRPFLIEGSWHLKDEQGLMGTLDKVSVFGNFKNGQIVQQTC